MIDINDRQHLIDNPRDVWWVSDPLQLSSTESKRSSEEQQDNKDNEDNDDKSSTATTVIHHSSVIREVQPVVVPASENYEKKIDNYLDFRQKRTDQIDINNMSPLNI